MPAQPPTIPPDLLERFGEPEHVFGSNVQYRKQSVILGSLLLLVGATFLVFGFLDRDAQNFGKGGGALMAILASGLLAMGFVAVYYPLRAPRNWLFVCPRGLIRYLNRDWDTLPWSDAVRFEDVSLPLVRQFKIVVANGPEWGFISYWFADYRRLTEVLREKVDVKATTARNG